MEEDENVIRQRQENEEIVMRQDQEHLSMIQRQAQEDYLNMHKQEYFRRNQRLLKQFYNFFITGDIDSFSRYYIDNEICYRYFYNDYDNDVVFNFNYREVILKFRKFIDTDFITHGRYINGKLIIKLIRTYDGPYNEHIDDILNIITSINYPIYNIMFDNFDIEEMIRILYVKDTPYGINFIIKYCSEQQFSSYTNKHNKIINNESIIQCMFYDKPLDMFRYILDYLTYSIDRYVIETIDNNQYPQLRPLHYEILVNYLLNIRHPSDECPIMQHIEGHDAEIVHYDRCPDIFEGNTKCHNYDLEIDGECCRLDPEQGDERFPIGLNHHYEHPSINEFRGTYNFKPTIDYNNASRMTKIYSLRGDRIINTYLIRRELPFSYVIYMYKFKKSFSLEFQICNARDFNFIGDCQNVINTGVLDYCSRITEVDIGTPIVQRVIANINRHIHYYRSMSERFQYVARLLVNKLSTLPIIILDLNIEDGMFPYITLYRGIRSIVNYRMGQFISFNSFTSTSIDALTAMAFTIDGGVQRGTLFTIYVPTGNKIIPLFTQSEFNNENEVLLPHDTIFYVSRIYQDPNTHIVICTLIVVNNYEGFAI